MQLSSLPSYSDAIRASSSHSIIVIAASLVIEHMLHEHTIDDLLLSLRPAHDAIGAILTDVLRQSSWVLELEEFLMSALVVDEVDEVDVGGLEILVNRQ